jgi:hypothetical protein
MDTKTIAEIGTILRGEVGSGVHGITLPGTDDRDEMGVCIEPPEYVIGLLHFEQYIYRSAVERTGREGARSEHGDLDLVVYSLRKWCRLALKGNPTVLLLLFLPESAIMKITPLGHERRGRSGQRAGRGRVAAAAHRGPARALAAAADPRRRGCQRPAHRHVPARLGGLRSAPKSLS